MQLTALLTALPRPRAAVLWLLVFGVLPVQAQWTNNQAAVNVIGQPNFTTTGLGTTATTLNFPTGVAVDPTTGKVFVADFNNSRVLRYSAVAALANGQAAEAVLGQPDFISSAQNTTPSGMDSPFGVFVDSGGRLWVADRRNHRVLRFDNAATKATGANADGVLGQPNFTSNAPTTTPSGMDSPLSVFVDSGGRLWVADTGNRRVLRFDNAATKGNGADADGVLGQPDFFTITATTTQNGMTVPTSVFVDSAGRLWVIDQSNHRVLRFDNAATKGNGANADGVLGQPNFTSNAQNTTPSGLDFPAGVFGDPAGRLFVSDSFNHRVLIFNNAATLANGANADNVLGQPDFTSDTPNNGGVSATSLNAPGGVFYDAATSSLYVAEVSSNHRVKRYVFTPPPSFAGPLLATTVGGRGNNLGANLADPAVCLDPGGLVGIHATVTNPNNVPLATSFTATLPANLTALAGTCVTDVPGLCTIAANGGSVSWNGNLNAGQSVNIIYRARLGAGVAQGTALTINNTATVGGVAANLAYTFTINCPLTNTRTSDQKAGSVLVFPYYTSTIGGVSDTRLTISHAGNGTGNNFVHLFLIDGASCQQSDLFLCLTPNASFSFKASDYDPGNTGYVIAVAVNAQGVPIQNNVLIGNAFVKTPTVVGNYGAESFWANNALALATMEGGAATLYFDQVGYDAVPKQFAVEIQSPADAVGQQVVTAALSGSLVSAQMSGAAQIGTGQAFNEKEVFASFSAWLTGGCQARGTISTTSPRVPNGLGNLIKSGQAGSLKFNVGAAVGLLLTPTTANWKGLRTLHKTATTATTLTIPVFAPVC